MTGRRPPGRRDLLSAVGALAVSPPAGTGLVDSHVHLWKIDPRFPFVAGASKPPDRDATPEQLLALMKAHGVRRSVVVQVSHHGWDHRYLVHCLRRYPRQLVGLCRPDPQDPAAPDQLERLVKAHGVRGMRLNVQPDPAFDWVRGPGLLPLLARCQALGAVLGVQTKWSRLPDIAALIARFPELPVVIDHMADTPADQPAELDRLLALARFPAVSVKISHTWWVSKQPYPYADSLDLVRRLYDRFGPRRLLWGTDWPVVERFCGYRRALEIVTRHMPFFTADDRTHILSGNAARLFKA